MLTCTATSPQSPETAAFLQHELIYTGTGSILNTVSIFPEDNTYRMISRKHSLGTCVTDIRGQCEKSNEKWHLLNEQDYHQNYNLLKELSEAL